MIIEQNIITVTIESQLPPFEVTIIPPPIVDVEISAQTGIPKGGITGNYLRKRSENDYDGEWSSSSASYYLHTQSAEAVEWIINHNLGRYPVVSPMSVGQVCVMAEIAHLSVNQTRIYFNQPYKGLAQCV